MCVCISECMLYLCGNRQFGMKRFVKCLGTPQVKHTSHAIVFTVMGMVFDIHVQRSIKHARKN